MRLLKHKAELRLNYFTATERLNLKRAFLTIRPKTLPASVAPVCLSQALAFSYAEFDLVLALCVFFCALFLQISVNLANDFSDFAKGVDTQERLGPKRASLEGWFSHKQLKIALSLSLLLSLVFGIPLILAAGATYFLLGALALVSVLAYSAGPYPLASNGLGELFVFVFFGLVAVIGGFCIHGIEPTRLVYLASVQMGCLTAAIMLINNIRDIHTDANAHKHTLAVLLGKAYARLLYGVLLFLPFVFLMFAPEFVLAWVALPAAIYLLLHIYQRNGAELNIQLGQTAGLCLVFALLAGLSLFLIERY